MNSSNRRDIAVDGYRLLRSTSRMAFDHSLASVVATRSAARRPWRRRSAGCRRVRQLWVVARRRNLQRCRKWPAAKRGAARPLRAPRPQRRHRAKSIARVPDPGWQFVFWLSRPEPSRCSTFERLDNNFGERPVRRTPDVVSRDARPRVAWCEARPDRCVSRSTMSPHSDAVRHGRPKQFSKPLTNRLRSCHDGCEYVAVPVGGWNSRLV